MLGYYVSMQTINIAAAMPFFRYAVGPTSQHSPAIPYFTYKGAFACFEEMVRKLPWAGHRIYKRTWFFRIRVVWEYHPSASDLARSYQAKMGSIEGDLR